MLGSTFAREGERVTLTTKDMADHIASKPELQKKIFGKILDEEELKKLEHNITSRVVLEVMESMESMNLRPLTSKEFENLKKAISTKIQEKKQEDAFVSKAPLRCRR